MALRVERMPEPLAGPFPVTVDDIPALNVLFSAAFTDRYRRDGLVGVRVPPLNPRIWEYAITGAGAAGAMLWRDEAGVIAAFNIAHRSGTEGWMGPLAVRDDRQGAGQGTMIVRAAIEHLVRAGCRTIGLETMPRTMDNIGFYSRLGFAPAPLTVTLTIEGTAASTPVPRLSTLSGASFDDAVAECRGLVHALSPGADYSTEIRLTRDFALGDTVVVRERDAIVAFALCHAAPLVEGRARDELRVLKLAARDLAAFDALLPLLTAFARRSGTARAAIRMQGHYPGAFRRVVAAGGRVRWTDLRMTLDGYPESVPRDGVVLTNWEI